MNGFFDPAPSTGTNRAATQDCENCHGLRLIDISGYEEDGREVYARCPVCNPAPTSEREPVDQARWKTYDR